jgi:peptidoglycan DL-endopeptidase RipB
VALGDDWASAFTAVGWKPGAAGAPAGTRFEIPPPSKPAAPPGGSGPRGGAAAPYWGLAEAKGRQHGLDPSLLAAVWDFESSGKPGAINKSSGATGLGQVMPRERGFPDRPTQAELLDPETNAEWSARILKSGLDRYGSEDKALAAYLGAIDARGNITGAVDANGTGGNQYIRTVRERQQEYGAGTPPAAAAAATAGAADDWTASFRAAGWKPQASAGVSGGASGAGAPPPSPRAAAPQQTGNDPGWLQLAQSQLGKPYIWGSKGGRSDFGPDAAGFDCSGFVAYVYKNALGVDIPAFTGSAYPATQAIAPQEAKAGDLVFYNMNSGDPRRQHVAIYLGDGRVIQSGGAGDGVNIAPVNQIGSAEFRRSPRAQPALAQAQPAVGRGAPTTGDGGGPLYLQGALAPADDWAQAFRAAGWKP